jgi:hypothetical protein
MNNSKLTQSTSGKDEHLLIEGEKKPWSQGTIHIFWPSAIANDDDERYVAWCREHAKGELRQPEEILPFEENGSYESRFCKTCIENARNSQNVEEPEFLKNVESRIESSQ